MKISSLQYIRAIAAIAVVFEHAALMSAFEKYFNDQTIFFDFFTQGHYGVKLFFIISGFIIVVSSFSPYSLEPRKTFSQFMKARFIRIVPLMWLAIISYALLRYFGTGDFDPIPYVNAIFLLPIGDMDPNNIWTLRFELLFYLFFGLSFLINKKMWPIFMIWILFPIILGSLAIPYNAINQNIYQELIGNLFSHLNLLFGTGVVIGLLYLKYFDDFNNEAKNLNIFNSAWFLTLFFIVSMILLMYLKEDYINTEYIATLISIPIFGLIVLFSIKATNKVNHIMFYLGNASYSIYLFHPHIESGLLVILKRVAPFLQVEYVVFIISIVSIIVGSLIYSYLETPLIRYFSRKFK